MGLVLIVTCNACREDIHVNGTSKNYKDVVRKFYKDHQHAHEAPDHETLVGYMYSPGDVHQKRDSEYVPQMHHTVDCDVYFKHETVPTIENYSRTQAVKSFWCATHGQWTYVFPTAVLFTYNDKPGGATNVD